MGTGNGKDKNGYRLPRVKGKHTGHKRLKEEMERKARMKAGTLRNYAKLVKREGVESNRVHIGDKSTKAPRDNKFLKKKSHQSISLDKAVRAGEKIQASKAEKRAAIEANQKRIKEREKRRSEKRKLAMEKTKKGQPVMKNKILSLLEKVQNSL